MKNLQYSVLFSPQKLGQKFFNVEVNQTFLKVRSKNLVKVTRIRENMWTKRLPTLRKLPSSSTIKKVLSRNDVLIMRIIIPIIINMDNIRQERPSEAQF